MSPFRPDLKDGQCMICGKCFRSSGKKQRRGSGSQDSQLMKAKDDEEDDEDEDVEELCKCPSATSCEGCKVRKKSLRP